MALRSPIQHFESANSVVTQPRLLVLLYERLLRDIDDAEAAFHERNRFKSNAALLHAQEIVSELESALDPSVWDAAKELSSLYLYIQGRLIAANVSSDLDALRECRSALEPLSEAWRQAWASIESDRADSGANRFEQTDSGRVSVDIAG